MNSSLSWMTASSHRAYRRLGWDIQKRRLSTWIFFDRKYSCEVCGPVVRQEYLRRIRAADWPGLIHVHLRPAAYDRRTCDRARKLGVRYVRVPIWGSVVFLGTDRISRFSEQVGRAETCEFIRRVLRLKDGGNISSTRGFLPPPLSDKPGFEAYHRDTARTCGHFHSFKEDAETCASEMGVRLDGIENGWWVRATGRYANLGSIAVKMAGGVEKVCSELDIECRESWTPESLEMESMAWNDERFEKFRTTLDWRSPPGRAHDWSPPPDLIRVPDTPENRTANYGVV